ncbi:ATP-binding protein [Cohaesibacter gelatinilyticus]|uniref:Histidine kinase-, DNA gyrase B-, and HSP90-like ATPase n=1 Tax=Cohaesibacter gelatinilyticus TaxID=372072 RepID=A0A285NDN6_9HYPH|nr:ATP-binding protein [Cohaesibacter gelatinilyticus]SNZ07418.1 Histidine kinase-, DNA gyrase B-, and HSP90-like ATPase [Cohaesibacter gelatinilyticus]
MKKTAHFLVNPRLTRLLGETYRSSEAALKELVDNAWDADALNVWIEVPSALVTAPIVVKDDGVGMSDQQIEKNYLDIASDKRRRSGEITARLKRKVKGRKGIGKFAGLTLASKMKIISNNGSSKCTLDLDKKVILEADNDLEKIPLDLQVEASNGEEAGSLVELRDLDQNLNYPTAEKLKELLFREYGQERLFQIHVNGDLLSISDLPGHNVKKQKNLKNAGDVSLHFTIAHSKSKPKTAGISLRVDGKIVGAPSFYGLENDEEIPPKLLKNLTGEISVPDTEGMVTADWGGVNESSKAYEELCEFLRNEIKSKLKETHSNQLNLQKARLQKQINKRLENLPEHRRKYAEKALNKILMKYYSESDERAQVIAYVALDAMEFDGYWEVLDKINEASNGEVQHFAEALSEFGLLEMSHIHSQARRRTEFLDYLDQLAFNPDTLEDTMHKALDSNLWVFGSRYSLMASNTSLSTIVRRFCDKAYSGKNASRRPDLLLTQGFNGRYLLIEFKRPSKIIGRDEVNQAQRYVDELACQLDSTAAFEIMVVGKGRDPIISPDSLNPNISIHSYNSLISTARNEIDWLLNTLK